MKSPVACAADAGASSPAAVHYCAFQIEIRPVREGAARTDSGADDAEPLAAIETRPQVGRGVVVGGSER